MIARIHVVAVGEKTASPATTGNIQQAVSPSLYNNVDEAATLARGRKRDKAKALHAILTDFCTLFILLVAREQSLVRRE